MSTIIIAFIGQTRKLHIMAGIFSTNYIYLVGKNPLLVGDMLVNFEDVLQETSKSRAWWDMGGTSHLKWLSSDSL